MPPCLYSRLGSELQARIPRCRRRARMFGLSCCLPLLELQVILASGRRHRDVARDRAEPRARGPKLIGARGHADEDEAALRIDAGELEAVTTHVQELDPRVQHRLRRNLVVEDGAANLD